MHPNLAAFTKATSWFDRQNKDEQKIKRKKTSQREKETELTTLGW